EGNKRIIIPTEHYKPANINKRIEKKKILKKEDEESDGATDKETESDSNEYEEEYEEETLGNQKTVCLNKEEKKNNFNIGQLLGEQETQMRTLLKNYNNNFAEKLDQLGRTSKSELKDIPTKVGMEQYLEAIRTYIQKLAAALEPEEFVFIDYLNRGNPTDPIILFEMPGANWNERLTNSSQEVHSTDTRRMSNTQILGTYYKLESIIAEKKWCDVAQRKFKSHFSKEREKTV
ncbi:21849_t:CDS:2, partial [Gigaspora margarita]